MSRKHIFTLGRPTDLEESLTCEFKEVGHRKPIKQISDDVEQYTVAYLNEVSGSVFWGIRDNDRTVTGVHIDHKMRDELRQLVGQKIGAIAPPVPSSLYDLPFHAVVSAEGEHRVLADTFVIELFVRAKKDGLYFTGSGAAYRKTLGGTKKLSGAELHNALVVQLDTKVKNTLSRADTRFGPLSELPSVLRRAQVVQTLLAGARALWVDDHPSNNLYERTMLSTLGVSADVAVSTNEALYMLRHLQYDIILSDMARDSNNRAGLELLEALQAREVETPIVFYVAQLDSDREIPRGAFGFTNRPDELMHMIFDILERRHL